jgi:hypothetical protein
MATTITYNTVPELHNLQSLHYNLLSLFPLVFTIGFLATDLNTGIVTVSLNHTLQILHTKKVFHSHLNSSFHTIRSSPTTNLPQLSATENCLENESQSLI